LELKNLATPEERMEGERYLQPMDVIAYFVEGGGRATNFELGPIRRISASAEILSDNFFPQISDKFTTVNPFVQIFIAKFRTNFYPF
jgi:hypothetical protein